MQFSADTCAGKLESNDGFVWSEREVAGCHKNVT